MAEFDRHVNDYGQKIDKSVSFSGLDHDYFTVAKAEVIRAALETYLSPSDHRVLDLGCGTAAIHKYLTGTVPKLIGADVSGESLKVAGRHLKSGNFLQYDGTRLPFADGTFDAVFSICVVHHVRPEARRAFFDEFYRVLRPGGLGMIIEHNPYNPLTRRVVNNCEFDRDAILLDAAECRTWLEDAGFAQIAASYFLFMPLSGAFSRRLERALKWLPLGAQYIAMGVRPGAES